jgi:hypothetical protein
LRHILYPGLKRFIKGYDALIMQVAESGSPGI